MNSPEIYIIRGLSGWIFDLLKNTFYMATSTFMRLLTGVVLFMVLARYWGVETFGFFVYVSTSSILLTLIVDYGFTQQLLRDIGQDPKRVRRIVSEAFATKVFLSFSLIGLAILCVPFTSAKHTSVLLFIILLIASILNSFAEFFNVAFRGLGRFHSETRIVTSTNLFHFVVVGLLAYLGQGPIVVAWGFLFSRVFYLILTYRTYRLDVGGFEELSFAITDIWKSLKCGFYYCADSALTNFYTQVDTLIVNSFLGPAGVGIYQAGLRLMLGANTFTQVLSNVYLPVVSHNLSDKREIKRVLCNMYLQMMLIGAGCCTVFIVGAKWITAFVYGAKFVTLAPLFPYFGLLLFFRYLAAVHGVTMTAAGLQGTRIYSILLAVIALVVSSYLLVPVYGLKGMLVSSILAILTLHIIYVARLFHHRIPLGLNRTNAIVSGIVFLLISLVFSMY